MTPRDLYRALVGFVLMLGIARGIDSGDWWLLLLFVLYGIAVWRSDFPLPVKEDTDG